MRPYAKVNRIFGQRLPWVLAGFLLLLGIGVLLWKLVLQSEGKRVVFVDTRDGTEYYALPRGKVLWMAEDLAYAHAQALCPHADTHYCRRDGFFYTWDLAKTICPPGWILPTVTQWEQAFPSPHEELPLSGFIDFAKRWEFAGELGYYWTADTHQDERSWAWFHHRQRPGHVSMSLSKNYGFKVRCVRPNTP